LTECARPRRSRHRIARRARSHCMSLTFQRCCARGRAHSVSLTSAVTDALQLLDNHHHTFPIFFQSGPKVRTLQRSQLDCVLAYLNGFGQPLRVSFTRFLKVRINLPVDFAETTPRRASRTAYQAIETGGLSKGRDIEVKLRGVGQRHRVERDPGVYGAKLVDVIQNAQSRQCCPSR